MKNINLKNIRLDGDTQSRVRIDEAAVADYTQVLRDGGELPPVVVFFDGAENWLADGFHRWHAYNGDKRASIPAEVRAGTQRDAILFSFGANGTHGLRRTNEDKRKAVAGMLADAEWSTWSDRKIAEQIGVTHPFVAHQRAPKVVTVIAAKPPAEAPKVSTVDTPEQRVAASRVVTVTTPSKDLASNRVESDSTVGPEDLEAQAAEAAAQAAVEAEQMAEIDALHVLIGTDDKLGAAFAEVKRQAALIRILEERIRSLQNGLNEQIRLTKSWRKKAETAQKADTA